MMNRLRPGARVKRLLAAAAATLLGAGYLSLAQPAVHADDACNSPDCKLGCGTKCYCDDPACYTNPLP